MIIQCQVPRLKCLERSFTYPYSCAVYFKAKADSFLSHSPAWEHKIMTDDCLNEEYIYIYIFNTVWGRHDVVNIFKLYGKSLKCFQKQTLCVFQVTKQQRGREMGKIIGESLSRPIPQIAFQWRIYKLSWTQTAKLQIRSGRVSQREDK